MGYTINRPDAAAMERLLERHPLNAAGAVLRLAWLEGLTREEIISLTWPDIDLEQREIRLPDRRVPLYPRVEACLRERSFRYGRTSPYVVISEKFQDAMSPNSVSRLIRKLLDEEGMAEIRLVDLRHDFIIRKLEEEEWSHVARISGLAVTTFQSVYAEYVRKRPAPQTQVERGNEYSIWKILQAERDTTVGLALWLRWDMGLQVMEMAELTWDQVDLEQGVLHLREREVPMTRVVRTILQERMETRPANTTHVLLTEKSQKPMDSAYLSKRMRTVLIRGGVEDVTIRNIRKTTEKEVEKMRILTLAEGKTGIVRADVIDGLRLSASAAHDRLKELVEDGALVQVYSKYYLPRMVLPPEQQEDALRNYIREHGKATTDELVELLHLERRQCVRILNRMAEEGKLRREGKAFLLPETTRAVE